MKVLSVPFAVLFSLFLLCAYAQAEETTADQIKQLKEENDGLKERLDDLENRVENYVEPEEPPPGEVSDAHKKYTMQIELRESFSDKQEAVPRPYSLTLDPTYRGFIPIPHTHAMIKFNAQPRIDLTNDSDYSGDENKFMTSQIPVSGQLTKGGGYHFNMNSQGSRLMMDVVAPEIKGNPRFYYENDFAGTGNAYMAYRVRHLYGEFYNIVAGQTYTIFEDADAWPDTVDYEGPNAAISSRRPLIKYMLLLDEHWMFGFGLEKPTVNVDTSNDPTGTSEIKAPEGGFSCKLADIDIGHLRFSTIFRDISSSGSIIGDQSVFGWGVSLAGNLKLFKRDSFQTQLTYGEGIYTLINDAVEPNDGAFNSQNKLRPLPVIALMGGYTHGWSDKFRSTASFGFVNVDNEQSQNWDAYHRTYNASLNLIFQLFKRLSFGAEGLYGYKQVKSGASGQVFRGQLSIMYILFK